jgi:crotonobetainyl-CoA:carnitine CoA-transferase CaiB-like acyl-CoA transferase
VQQVWPAIRAAQTGATPTRLGNDDPAAFRQGVYPAAGQDRWVAISTADAAEWDRLRALAGGGDVAAWTATQTDHALVDKLQGAGLAAGPCRPRGSAQHDPAPGARRTLSARTCDSVSHTR